MTQHTANQRTQLEQLVIIDGNVQAAEQLLSQLDPDTRVLWLEPGQDGISQISETLASYSDIATVQLFSHGSSASLSLGNSVLTADTLATTYHSQIEGWHQALAPGADILLYGCNVAAGEAGEAFVEQLAQVTGADIAASDDLTGSTALNSDWQLEHRTGDIDIRPMAFDTYSYLLTDGQVIFQDGSGGGGSYVSMSPGGRGGNGAGGNSTLTGGVGNDLIMGDGHGGGGGSSSIGKVGNGGVGGSGTDTLSGGAGNDIIFGDGFTGNPGGAGGFAIQAGDVSLGGGSGGISSSPDGAAGFGAALGGSGGTGNNGIADISGGEGQTASTPVSITDTGGAHWAAVKGVIDNNLSQLLTPTEGMGSGSDTLNGDAGDDYLFGMGGEDTLNGGAGSDHLYGMDGEDTLNGGAGSDHLYGMDGVDTFVFEITEAGSADTDIVYDWNVNSDKLELTFNGEALNASTVQGMLDSTEQMVNGDRIFTFSHNNQQVTVNLKDQGDNALTTANFITGTATLAPPTHPVISNLDGDGLTFTEGDSATLLDQNTAATLTDSNSPDFDGGNLTVTVAAGGTASEDLLSLDSSGNVSINSNEVSVSGTAIGTLANALTAGNDLVINLNSDANATNVQTLLQALTYQNTNTDNPSDAARTIRVTVNDGDGETSTNSDITVNVTAVNDKPVIANLNGDSTAYEAGDGAVLIDQGSNLTVTDADSADFDGATLTVTLTTGAQASEDQLGVLASGSNPGEISLQGSTIMLGTDNAPSNIGTMSGGTNGDPLVITFSSSATAEAVETVARQITYENTAQSPDLATRTISFVLTDGDNATADTATTSVAFLATPVISNLNGDSVAFTEDDGATLLDQNTAATLSDSDSSDFDGGNLTVTITSGRVSSEDLLSFDQSGVVAITGNDVSVDGTSIGTLVNAIAAGNDLVVNLKSAANAGNVQTLLQALSYQNTNTNDPTEAARTVRVTVNDGDGGTSSNADITVNVTAVNDKPVISNLSGDTVSDYRANDGAVLIDQNADLTITDVDSADFSAGALTVTVTTGAQTSEDVLAIKHTGSSPGEIGLSGTDVQYGGITIGAFMGGDNGNPLLISFNSSADAAAVSALASQITYENTATAPTTTARTIEYVLTDGDGATGMADTVSTTVDFYVAPAPTPVPTTPQPQTEEIDGAVVETSSETDSTGNAIDVIRITPVSGNRNNTDTTTEQADIPLHFADGNSDQAVTVLSLPTGIGVEARANTSAHAQNSLEDLINLINETAGDTESDRSDMVATGERFLAGLSDSNSELWVNQITLTTDQQTASDIPVKVTGTAASEQSNYQEALVIDTRQLPEGTTLELADVEFAVVVGDGVSIRGGEGANIVYAGEGSQDIMLGADDDELHAGAGDDTVGSAGGDDLIFGEDGNDTLFGGAGNDQLHGGQDTDTATYESALNAYTIEQQHGVITVTAKDDPTDSDTLINIEQIQFSDQRWDANYNTELSQIATLYNKALDRQADLDGFQYWSGATQQISTGDMALHFLRSEEYSLANDVQFDQLSAEQQIEQLYQGLLGRDSDADGKAFWLNELNSGSELSEIANAFVQSDELSQQYITATGWDFIV